MIDRAHRQRGMCVLFILRQYDNHIFQFYKTKMVKGHYCALAGLKKGLIFGKGILCKIWEGHVPPSAPPPVPTSLIVLVFSKFCTLFLHIVSRTNEVFFFMQWLAMCEIWIFDLDQILIQNFIRIYSIE